MRTPLGDEAMDLDEFEDRVRRGEVRPDALVCFPAATGEKWIRAEELEVFRGLYDPVRIYFKRYFSLSRFPVLTSLVVGANLLVFGAMVLLFPEGGGSYSMAVMIDLGAKASPLIVDLGQTWRLLTANFVHKDVLHLAFNMFVLFNVGGALENAFRPLQYLAVLLSAALCTTLLSFFASDSVSAGASGVVFGCLGGLVVFGAKYREIIPARYRGFFGAAVAPYVLVFLWMGWMSSGIDNWGHLGGLIGGAAATALQRPRLLAPRARSGWREPTRGIAIAAVLVAVVLGGPLWSRLLSTTEVHRDDISGVVIGHPKSWRRVVTPLGDLGLGNGLPEAVWVQARFEVVPPPVDLSAIADRWLGEQLHGAEQAGRIRSSRWRGVGEASVAGLDALEYEAAFEVVMDDGRKIDYRLRLFAFARGDLAYSLALAGSSRRFHAYEPIFEGITRSIRLDEPRFLRHARAAVLLSPEDEYHRKLLDLAVRRSGSGATTAPLEGLGPGREEP